ncbi:CRIB domain-containing protein RIC7-like [Phragmites australis]|uniref:CRIB domain-containing protein RIC7-like n=1 Tax=Phragmites australis TaxID=29695 RepID=UPI002D79D83E|nr:CRIB domain-containing protein RIC7-like [Phragmites australis]XP_062187902.1 CRIB domain-containing protein RIC7-like [Phragmites australis]
MSTKMKKGILRPFRYISNMMDGKEPEMQIGFPTDVKHVAHIGWDGPSATNNNNNNAAGAPSWMKDYHSAPLDSASFRSERGGTAASNPWASQEIVMDGESLGDTSFRDTRSEAGGIDVAGGDSPPSPGTRRSRRHRSRGSATSSIDCMGGEATEKKEKGKKGTRKNRKKDKDKLSTGDDATASGSATCQDLPAVPKKSNRRKTKGSSEGSGGAAAAPEEGSAAPLPPVAEDKDREW